MLNPKGFIRQWLLLICGDTAVAVGSVYGAAAAVAWLGLGVPSAAILPEISAIFAIITVFASYLTDLYKPDLPYSRLRIIGSLACAQPIILVSVVIVLYADRPLLVGRGFLLFYMLISFPTMLAWRIAAAQALKTRLRIGVAILGIGEGPAMVAEEVMSRGHLGYTFVGFVELAQNAGVPYERSIPAHTPAETRTRAGVIRVTRLAQLETLSVVRILAIDDSQNKTLPYPDLVRLQMGGREVLNLETLYERITGRLPTTILSEPRLAIANGFLWSRTSVAIKRLLDVLLASGLALLTMPIMIIVAIAIKLDSPGSVLYTQERVGRDARIFRVLKFRSMRQDAERETGAVGASEHDPRITRVGGWLRKWRIDELPQLLNVLRGEMTMVGPRPERPEFVALFAEQVAFYDYRHLVRPGLTGWAQICYPYGATVSDAQEKLCYDLYYLKNWSLGFDLQIMLQTIKVVLLGRGAR